MSQTDVVEETDKEKAVCNMVAGGRPDREVFCDYVCDGGVGCRECC